MSMKLAHRILATTLLPAMLTLDVRADLLTQWTFQPPPADVTGTTISGIAASTGTGTASGFHADPATAWSTPVGNGSSDSLSSNTWAIGDYYQFQTTTVGYEGITLSWDQTRSATGPGLFDLAWSVDGTNFTVFTDDYSVDTFSWSSAAANPASTKTADLSSVTALVNASAVYFRLVAAAAPSAAAGTNRVDNFTVNGVTFTGGGGAKMYWDTSGAGEGIGGEGTWSSTSTNFSTNELGNIATTVLDPSATAVFGGTGATVTIGAGATANAGIEIISDGYTLDGGSILLGGALAYIRVTNASDAAAVTGSLSGTIGLRKLGAGRLILASPNTYTGTTTVQEGVLQISEDNQLGPATNPLTLNGGTLHTTASMILDAARVLSGTGTLSITAGTTLGVAGNTAFTSVTLPDSGELLLTSATPALGSITMEQATTITAPNGTIAVSGNITANGPTGTTIIAGSLDLGSAQRTFTVANGDQPVDLRITGNVASTGANGRILKLGEGTMEILGNAGGLSASFQLGNVGVTPATGGKLIVRNDTGLGAGEFRFNAGELFVDSPTPVTFANSISIGAGQIESTLSGAAMTFSGPATLFRPTGGSFQHRIVVNTEVTFAGGLNASTGTGSSFGLTIAGNGIVHLPNTANSISEGISVDGAELRISGDLSARPVLSVLNGGILSGLTNTGGDLNERLGAVFIQATGVIAPGISTDEVGALDTSSFTLQADAIFDAQIGGILDGDFDQIRVGGTVELAGNLSLSFTGTYSPFPGDTFVLILNDDIDPVVGAFTDIADDVPFDLLGTSFSVDYQGGDGNDVVLSVVPEPGSTTLLLLAGAALFARRRRTLA